MQITFVQQGVSIAHSDLLRAVHRTDLVPVPVSLELTVLATDELKKVLIEGAELVVGDDPIILSVVKLQPVQTGFIKDGKRIGAIDCIAIPKECLSLIKPSDKAVILQQTSFNSAFRACGARLSLGGDIPLPEFICLKGTIPTERLALYAQQEASVVRANSGKLEIVKLDALIKQDAVIKLDESMVLWEQSSAREFFERPSFVSTEKDGAVIGDVQKNHRVMQRSGLDSRQLRNLNKILMRKGVVLRPMQMEFKAGNVFLVGEKKYIVLTAAHAIKTGAIGGESSMVSKYWIASL